EGEIDEKEKARRHPEGRHARDDPERDGKHRRRGTQDEEEGHYRGAREKPRRSLPPAGLEREQRKEQGPDPDVPEGLPEDAGAGVGAVADISVEVGREELQGIRRRVRVFQGELRAHASGPIRKRRELELWK